MLHSTVTSRGQITIPRKIREALRIKPGDRLVYAVRDSAAIIRVHPGACSLAGALASDRGKGLTFAQIRDKAARYRMQQSAR